MFLLGCAPQKRTETPRPTQPPPPRPAALEAQKNNDGHDTFETNWIEKKGEKAWGKGRKKKSSVCALSRWSAAIKQREERQDPEADHQGHLRLRVHIIARRETKETKGRDQADCPFSKRTPTVVKKGGRR